MPTYTNVFGGNAVKPADVSYSALAMTANATLTWPGFGQSPSTSSIMDISSNAAYNLTMPPASQVSPGESVSFNNTGSFIITIKDNAGGTIVSIAAGTVWDVYVKTNATAAGTWGTLQRGAGTSAANAADLDGAGLEASAGLLRVKAQVTTLSISTVITESHRAKIVEWTGGTGTFTITAAASLGDGWYCFFKNNGSGPCTVAPTETVDGEVSVILSPGQGCLLSTDGVDFTSIAMNDPAEATLGYASISVAGTGNYTLSASEYANKAIKFTGVLTGNRVIIVPTSLREYIINNATTGAFTLTAKTVAGTGVAVTQTKSAYLYCDGTNVVAAETDEGAGITIPVAIADGGTGAITAPAALTNLGGTAIGTTIFTAADAAAVRAAISCAALIANTFSDTQTITKDDAVTAAVTDLFIITHSTSGTAAVGFGGGLVYKLEDTAGSIETVASVDAVLTDATNGSEDVKLSFKTMIAGAAKTEVGYIGAGWVVGAPTGGDKGIGTLNVQNGLYRNNVLITSATTSAEGFVEIATLTEDIAAVDTVRAVTPEGLGAFSLPGYINGLNISNNGTDANNDLDIAVGSATDLTSNYRMVLASAITKRLDAGWAVGTNQGGLDTGAEAASTSYHVWLIARSDTRVVDVLFSASATAPTMPANYDKKRRIGSFNNDNASAIVPFKQVDDTFLLTTSVVTTDATNPGTAAVTRTLRVAASFAGVPNGVVFDALIVGGYYQGTSVNSILFSSLDTTDSALQNPNTAALTGIISHSNQQAGSSWAVVPMTIRTDTSAAIRSRLFASGAGDHVGIIVTGWIDTRGK